MRGVNRSYFRVEIVDKEHARQVCEGVVGVEYSSRPTRYRFSISQLARMVREAPGSVSVVLICQQHVPASRLVKPNLHCTRRSTPAKIGARGRGL
jgi:hypothetical protein